jgi:hypothetical protein
MSRSREKTIFEVYGTTFARITEIKPGRLIRRVSARSLACRFLVRELDRLEHFLRSNPFVHRGHEKRVRISELERPPIITTPSDARI